MTRRTPTVLYYEGISRYMEGQVLHLQKQIEEQAENAQDSGVELLKVRPLPGWLHNPSARGFRSTLPANYLLITEFVHINVKSSIFKATVLKS